MDSVTISIIVEGCLFAFAAGLVYGIFGGGSGLFLMPGFYFLLRHFPNGSVDTMQVAIATTAATSALLGIMPTLVQLKQKHLDFSVVKKVFFGVLTGTIVAVILLNFIPSAFLKKLFGIAVILVAFWFWFYNQAKDKKSWQLKGFPNYVWTSVIGLLWFLLGIAVFTVPYLHKCGIEMRRSVGSGTFVSTIFSLIAAILLLGSGIPKMGISTHHLGYINLTLLFIALIPSVIAAYVGAKVSVNLPQKYLKKVYACLILVIGIIMLA